MRRLILAEKFSAARRLAHILSEGTTEKVRADGFSHFTFSTGGIDVFVFPLRGHVVEIDYPDADRDWRTTDLDALIDTEPIRRESPPALHDALRQFADTIDEVVLATDYDREGELIGIEALETLRERRPDLPARRARFSSMAAGEVRRAFAAVVEPDWALAEAAAARQRIDLAWGAVLTRFLSLACDLRGRDFLSVGRVQTPTLGLLVEREREIEEFVPEPYWVLTATLESEPPTAATHATDRFWRRDEAVVEGFDARTVEGHRPPPFNTTSFLAEATRLGMGAARAMQLAEGLYRRGLISYPRTDNTVYPPSLNLRSTLERLRESDLAAEASELLGLESLRASRGPVRATDHPPIYPTGAGTRSGLKGDAWRVYELVVRRFLATVAPATQERDSVAEFDLGGERFFARWRDFVELGWRKYYGPTPAGATPPSLTPGDRLRVLAVVEEPRETDPPPRYTQGELIVAMEEKGLGTKSTRHEIVQKLYDRGYAGGRRIRVTAAGRAVVEALEAHGGQVTRPDMTAALELAMDGIARGEREAAEVVRGSRALLAAVLAEMRAHETGIARWVRTAIADEVEVGPCERCGGTMLLRRARTGWRFVGCSNFPTCRNTRPMPGSGLVTPTEERCEQCGARKLARVHRGAADLWCATPTCSDAELARILGA